MFLINHSASLRFDENLRRNCREKPLAKLPESFRSGIQGTIKVPLVYKQVSPLTIICSRDLSAPATRLPPGTSGCYDTRVGWHMDGLENFPSKIWYGRERLADHFMSVSKQ